jgi:hypothetical protein
VVAMSAIQTPQGKQSRLRTGAALMTLAGLAFVAYAVVFLVLIFLAGAGVAYSGMRSPAMSPPRRTTRPASDAD